jgi:hypothetical protein
MGVQVVTGVYIASKCLIELTEKSLYYIQY